jgi:hypothetical protein
MTAPFSVPTAEQYARYYQRLNELILEGVPMLEAELQAVNYAMQGDEDRYEPDSIAFRGKNREVA